MADVSNSAAEFDGARAWWHAGLVDVPSQIEGLIFGLVALSTEDQPEPTLYLAGSYEFDPDDGGDWASDPAWWASDRYWSGPTLRSFDSSQWAEAERHARELVAEILDPAELPASVQGVGCGWDDGDLEIIWSRNP